MVNYNAPKVEAKWKKKWNDSKLYETDLNSDKEKYYNLAMFPYPSGDKLHIGHWYNFGPSDSHGRYMRMLGKNVFQPMGFDSFGLPAENYAIKTGVHPQKSTETNAKYMKMQLSAIGAMYDWDKSLMTSSSDYYKWTQWLFLKLYENNLAYKKTAPVNWCPSCQTVLANEQVEDGICERCKTEVTKKNLNQWFFNIRKYAEKLLDYDGLNWPSKTIAMQKHWIGKSTGSEITFKTDNGLALDVFTTRIDTLFGCTYMVVAPEHPLADELVTDKNRTAANAYIEATKKLSDIERGAEGRDKTGVFTGTYAVNPLTGKKIQVWIADYVLAHYGTGAVMAVPAHDYRDFEFAKKFDLEIIGVISKDGTELSMPLEEAFTNYGLLYNCGEFSGLESEDAKNKITNFLEKKGSAKFKINYKLRDWLVSRQRYWGAPIPIVYCDDCGEVTVPEDQLPIKIPEDLDFMPKGDGKSPLAHHNPFVKCACPKCGKDAKREVDTMDTFVCSSWYYLRYPSNTNCDVAFDKDLTEKWSPVDMYIGGPEHACMHLLYARFINMFLHDLGYVKYKEPFKRLMHQGMITKDGAKMSKSKGNVVSPDSFVEKYGSDVFRMYLMFMGPFTDGGDWNDKGITGTARFVDRFWKMISGEEKVVDEKALEAKVHQLIKKCTIDIEKFSFNTMIAAMMEFLNFINKNGINRESKDILTRLIAPIAPHLAEECFEYLGHSESVFKSEWPKYIEELTKETTVTIGIQITGKVRGEIKLAVDEDKDSALNKVKAMGNIAKYLSERKIVKEIYVPGRIIGFVVK